ncbi:MAG: C-GCAxxG-C-C family protein [Victivallaceae bacterium]|nr:C-GCAxxG-C-C family protein [Victivallaceae bacterium]
MDSTEKERFPQARAQRAKELFLAGANCAQAVAGAFADLCGADEKTLFRIASGFGGGVGRLREVCGAVSGMTLIADVLYASDDITDKAAKDAQYARVRSLAEKFRSAAGSIVCRELLHLPEGRVEGTVSDVRDAHYYQKRPCLETVALAAEILAGFIAENPPPRDGGKTVADL